jgi:hypothetical protein
MLRKYAILRRLRVRVLGFPLLACFWAPGPGCGDGRRHAQLAAGVAGTAALPPSPLPRAHVAHDPQALDHGHTRAA